MLRRITLENFMSHQHTVIDLAEGLTVLTGPNNCGKSAVVAALQILASNGKTTHVMRHGSKVARITAETDDGHVICWQRKKASVSYTLDGEDIHRVGQGIPDGLHDLLRMPIVEADAGKTKVSYDIHFGEQKSPVFLLGDPGSRAASFFAAASDASRLLEMTVKHRSNVKDNRQNAKRLNAELEACAEELVRLTPVDELAERLAEAQQKFADITKAAADLERIKALRADLQSVVRSKTQFTGELHSLQQVTAPPQQHGTAVVSALIVDLQSCETNRQIATETLAVCQELKNPPDQQPTSECRRRLNELTTTAENVDAWRAQTKAFQSLIAPPVVHPTAELNRQIAALNRVVAESHRASDEASALQDLSTPARQQDTKSLQLMIAELAEKQRTQAESVGVVERLQKLTPPTAGTPTTALQTTLQDLKALKNDRATLQQRADEGRQLLADCETRLRAFVESNPRCGTCGSELDPDKLLAAAPGMEGHRHA